MSQEASWVQIGEKKSRMPLDGLVIASILRFFR